MIEGEVKMKAKQMVHLLQDNFVTVDVLLPGRAGVLYTYKALISDKPAFGDYVMVSIARKLEFNTTDSLSIVKIGRVIEVGEEPNIDYNSTLDYKWIVKLIKSDDADCLRYNNLMKLDAEIEKRLQVSEAVHRRAQLKAQLTDLIGTGAMAEICCFSKGRFR